jgi:hypothetical protein
VPAKEKGRRGRWRPLPAALKAEPHSRCLGNENAAEHNEADDGGGVL